MAEPTDSDPRSWLYSFTVRGTKLDLENTEDLLGRLGNPQLSVRCVHVGGTDGKGSISSCIASILISSGIKTGLYTSPHITDFSERITVNGEKITDDDMRNMLRAVREGVEGMEAEGRVPTFFEVTTAMAFLYFKNKGVEYAVIEVGMGGRLDSTNVIIPEVSVIGNISMEHEDFLGDTIEKIAFEKAGIIKPGVPCVTMNRGPALSVLKKIADERGSQMTNVDSDRVILERMYEDRTVFTYKDETYSVSIPGSCQAANASVAIEAVSKLGIFGKCLRCNVRKGLAEVRWPCRLEKIKGLPIIMDVTHTGAGSRVLAEDVSRLYGKVDVIVGMLKDKDAEAMAENLSAISERAMISGLNTERSADPEDLRKAFGKRFSNLTVHRSVSDAMDKATGSERSGNIILVTGSFHTAEEAIEWLGKTYPGYWTYSQKSTTGEHIPEDHRKV
ncbi:MAG: bifunctional folylpolyglutamate synthase/dihydrofolate synthase [Candidatus Methanoplasma sp.]|jgi:dihydrofolate synthase/folylpolyglutamate synthase|nr:bifunctional folylpolyglutamate synthase/dihydrofolate synthase [Candidatus Methanoplasma sp.]